MKLKHTIQYLNVIVDKHNTNSNHKDFKEPFPKYDKGEGSKSKNNTKVNYMYSKNHNMLEQVEIEYCNMIIVKNKYKDSKSENIITRS